MGNSETTNKVKIKIAIFDNKTDNRSLEVLPERSLIYNVDQKILYYKPEKASRIESFLPLGALPDNKNIIIENIGREQNLALMLNKNLTELESAGFKSNKNNINQYEIKLDTNSGSSTLNTYVTITDQNSTEIWEPMDDSSLNNIK